jgi:serine/threonine protein kinase
MASSSFPPRLGALLADRFQLRELLGAGGVGQVFKAWDVTAQRQVTVKAFNPARVNNASWAAYVKVVGAAATARHPDLVLPEGLPAALPDTPLATTPALAGDDLAKLRARTVTIPWARALEIGERAADILHAVHSATGLAHRDLKATNLLVTPEGAVKVLDWGIAEFDEQSGDRTRVDTALGVVDYKSPEQLDSNQADAKSDQFSLAVIIYEMITGERPFTGPSYFEVARKILFQPSTPLAEAVPDAKVPPAVDAMLQRALQKRPADRYPDMKAMQRALAEARRGAGKSLTSSLKTTTPSKVTTRAAAQDDDDVTTMAIRARKRTSTSDARPRQPQGQPIQSVAPTQIAPPRAGATVVDTRRASDPPDATVVGPAPNADRTVALADMEQIAAQAGVRVPRTVIDLEPRKSSAGAERTLILGDEGTPSAAPAEGTLILGDDAHPKPAEGTLLIPDPGGPPPQAGADNGGGTMMIQAPRPSGGWTLQKTLILINVACGILILIGLFVLVMSG